MDNKIDVSERLEYGADRRGLFRRLDSITDNNTLDVSHLFILKLPPLPSNLRPMGNSNRHLVAFKAIKGVASL